MTPFKNPLRLIYPDNFRPNGGFLAVNKPCFHDPPEDVPGAAPFHIFLENKYNQRKKQEAACLRIEKKGDSEDLNYGQFFT